jgi:hypothetical protein
MTTIWKSTKKAETNNTFSGTTLSSWSRQQKLAMIASFALLGLLLAVSACSKQSSKTALVSVSSTASNSAIASTTMASANSPVQAAALSTAVPTPAKAAKKVPKKRPANVTYSDPNSGVSFVYPRKFQVATGEKAQPQFGDKQALTMNFVEPGGVTVATVAVPHTLYPGTDFAKGFFTVNVNRSLSEQECSHFAFVDMSDADGEPIDALKVKVGSTDMEMTSEYAGSALAQSEAQYYHNYENGACYEYVLGLGTAGYGAQQGIEPVNRDEVFARLEKILATVKTQPVAQEPVAQQPKAEQTVADAGDTK